jgi:STE24 endopeptidase
MITAVILTFLLGYYLLDCAAKILNLRCLHGSVPSEFADIYDTTRYQRSQDYTRTKTIFDLISSTILLVVLLIFWFGGGFDLVDRFVRALHLPSVPTGLLYLAILATGREVLSLPFDWVHTFVIEQRFGFNRTTVRTFLADRIKGWLLGALLGGALLSFILWLLHRFGVQAWPVAWAITAIGSVLLMYFAPALILPLFFKLNPLPAGELRDRITALCQSQNFPVRDLFVIDGSRRSAKANAFFSGFGRNKRIALYDTLINNHTTEELLAVLAHEIGHFKRRHVLQHFAFAQLNLFLLFAFASICLTRPEVYAAFKVEHPSVYVGLALISLLLQPFSLPVAVLVNYWSRLHEFEADSFAAKCLEDGNALISALKKLSKDTLSNLTPHPLLVSLHFTHPPVLERVHALRALAAGRNGDTATGRRGETPPGRVAV